jgi:hydrogenase nickel incorporation protein HypA/HybF
MHELAVTESILEISLRHAEQAGAAGIMNLYLVVGELSSIVDDSVQFYWDIISEGTKAEGALLHFKRIPAEMQCRACQHSYLLADNLVCPQCDSSDVLVVAGSEFFLESLEVETGKETGVAV